MRSDALLQHYRAHTGAITGAVFHPSGSFLLTSSLDTTLKVGRVTHNRRGARLDAAWQARPTAQPCP